MIKHRISLLMSESFIVTKCFLSYQHCALPSDKQQSLAKLGLLACGNELLNMPIKSHFSKDKVW